MEVWRSILALALTVAAVVSMIGCPPPPTPDSIIGDYEGTYHVLSYNPTDTIIDETDSVTVRFTNTAYILKVAISPLPGYLCSSSGDYLLDKGIEFVEDESNLDTDTCAPDYNVRGFFGLDRVTYPGKLLIKQDETHSAGTRAIKTLLIRKITD